MKLEASIEENLDWSHSELMGSEIDIDRFKRVGVGERVKIGSAERKAAIVEPILSTACPG